MTDTEDTAAQAWTPTPVVLPRYFSASELKTWKDCRRRWALDYWLKMQPRRLAVVGPLPLGTRVHKALEVHRLGGDPMLALQEMAERERALISGPVALLHVVRDGEEAPPVDEMDSAARAEMAVEHAKECELAEIMVRGYLDWLEQSGVDEGLTLVGTERKVEVSLAGRPGAEGLEHVVLRGRQDVTVDTAEGVRAVVDYKTAKDWRLVGTLHMVEQFLHYLLLERLDPQHEKPVHGVLVDILRKVKRTSTAKPPFYARELVTHSDAELRAYYRRTLRTIRDVLALEAELNAGPLDDLPIVAYPSPAPDCSWKCPHFLVCPMMDRGERWRAYLQEHYTAVDPADRYGDTEDET